MALRTRRGRGGCGQEFPAGARARRGAIAVMAGVFIVAIMLVTAISVDASRIFVAKNELQTAADAAALAGAVQLLKDSTTAGDSARIYGLRNRVDQGAADSIAIEFGVWQPNDGAFIPGGDPLDAVRVTARHALPLSMARVFGDSMINLTSSAVAWSSAPVVASPCAKPIAVPYSELMRSLGYPSWVDANLTDDDIRRLREMPEDDRRTHFHYGDPNLGRDTDDSGDDDDHYQRAQYFPVDIDSSWSRLDPLTNDRPGLTANTFQSYVVGPPTGRCSRTVRPGDVLRSEPADKRDALRDGLSDICGTLGGTLTGSPVMSCRSNEDGSLIVLPMKVIFWRGDLPAWQGNGGRAMLEARITGSFVLTQFKWEPDDDSGRGQHARITGHWSVASEFGPIAAESSSMLLRPVLVR